MLGRARASHGSIQTLKDFPKAELYRFIVDGRLHVFEQGWLGYATREENSLPAAFSALEYALTEAADKGLSVELIKGVHKLATENVKRLNTATTPGKFRKDNTGYYIFNETADGNGSVSKDGFYELYNQVAQDHQRYGSSLTIVDQNFLDELTSQQDYHERLDSLQHVKMSKQNSWRQLEEGKLIFYRAPQSIYLEKIMAEICETYNTSIQSAIVDDGKLSAIATAVMQIARTHAFSDGNGRTSYILLQRLLILNGFLPTILRNPNNMDGYTVREFVIEIKEGMGLTKQLIEQPTLPVYGYRTTTIELPHCAAPELIRHPKKIINNYYAAEQRLYDFFQSLIPTLESAQSEEVGTSEMAPDRRALLASIISEKDNLKDTAEGSLSPGNDLRMIKEVYRAIVDADEEKLMILRGHHASEDFQHYAVRSVLKIYKELHHLYNKARGREGSFAFLMSTAGARDDVEMAKQIKKDFVKSLAVVLPYLDKATKEQLLLKLKNKEAKKPTFLNDHRKAKFQSSFMDTKTWGKVIKMLTEVPHSLSTLKK